MNCKVFLTNSIPNKKKVNGIVPSYLLKLVFLYSVLDCSTSILYKYISKNVIVCIIYTTVQKCKTDLEYKKKRK